MSKNKKNYGWLKTKSNSAKTLIERAKREVPHFADHVKKFKHQRKELNEAMFDLKQEKWEKIQLYWQQIAEQKLGIIQDQCPHCKELSLRVVKTLEPCRPPPIKIKPSLKEWLKGSVRI
ncbi:hypothetical protein SAMN06298216_4115 [Spirosomataceae bacterium TFI 002]|nr:hypothetical protein SAMN06298216_4115 [Spirosomataceae bacterium TFI 002]